MTRKVYIHATNVHQGGGLALLGPILKTIYKKAEFVLSLDERMPIPDEASFIAKIKRVKPSILHRFLAEKWLAANVTSDDLVLCFGNLPPLFKLCGRCIVFVQNRFLIDNVKLSGFSIRVRLQLTLERLWFARRMSNVAEFIVQTPTMKMLLEQKTLGKYPIRVLPFVSISNGYVRSLMQLNSKKQPNHDFVYVASGEPHKNHRRLIDAWCLLADTGLFPSLCLTLDKDLFETLWREIEMMSKRCHLNVNNMGNLSHKDIFALYKDAGAAIYPSKFESFGLPLIEARQSGLPVLASELDYVRDVLDPEQTFDPDSPASIARAVKRFMGINEKPLQLLDVAQFVASFSETE